MILHQHPYVLKVLKHFQMENVKHVCTPLPSGYQPEKAPINYKASASDRQQYQSIIGSLLFVMLGTRLDIAFSVIKMSQYMANPMKEHIQKALHIVKYLGSTPLLALSCTGGDSTLDCYCNSDWAGDLESQCSTSDYFIFMGNDMVSWRSHRQPTVALSSTEAKYMSMCDCAQQIL